jgi:signal transduction histidine kinase/DNA-binding response OmpR family regulator
VVADRNYFSHSGANSLSGNMLQGIQPDVDGNFWVSTYRAGLNKVDVANQKIVQFTEHSSQHKLFSDEVSAISVDNSKPYVWVAMRNRVVRMNIRDYHQDEMTDSRLTDSYINGMADDGQGIWLSTTAGLFVVDKSTLELKQVNVGIAYFSAIGYSSVLQSIIVGGVNELVTFNPRTVLDDDRQNALCITAMWVNDKLVQPNLPQSMALDRSLRFTHTIELPANENNLLLAFSGFRYSDGAGVQYVYQLEGEDAYWRYTDGSTNRISYNNLRPGKYVLQIARVGSDGKPMSHPLRLAVTILHPWYSTLLAKIIYLLLLGALVLAIFNYWVMLHRLRYERMEKVKTMELTNHKIEFLTNISHELKTPLSLIVGPLSRLIEQVKTPVLKETLEGVRQNALKMSTLLHQLMEASRQDTTGFELVTASTDIVLLLRSIVAFFEKPLAARDVRIELSANVDSVSIVGDVLKLESVFNNILSNAAKFAPDHSLITVKVDASENQIEVVVMDEGPGIPPADLPLVFDRFFQSQHSLTQNNEGSGVGLSIVKEYVQLHGGTVNALSDGQHGTTIKVMLPRSFEMTESADAFTVQARQRVDDISVKPVVLIVEDNEEILSFLANALSREFKCHTALNGKLGFEAALEMNPDIIVTDIMMSVMDGLAMCRKLKDNVTTANIPVVMLTAKDDKNTELSGYRTGADAFIAKPFEVSYLSDRLHLLLQGRQHLVQKARQQAIIQPKEIEAVSADEKFLQTITKIIEEEITQEDLNVNWLSEKSGYSAKQVYRRIKALTGQTAVDYIRTVKLKKAALLLSKKTFTVAEVMYMVGFNNHSYFAKRFHEMYGKSPKQFMEEA